MADFEISHGEELKEKLNPTDLDPLLDLFIKEVFDEPLIQIPELRETIRAKIQIVTNMPRKDFALATLKLPKKIMSSILDIVERYRSSLEKTEGRRARIKEDLLEAIERGDLFVAMKKGKPIGIASARTFYSNHTNSNVVEIGRSVTLPEERGKKVNSEIKKQLLEHIQSKYPDLPILAGTHNPLNIKYYQNRKDIWKEIGIKEYLKIHGVPEERLESQLKWFQEKGATAFQYILPSTTEE